MVMAGSATGWALGREEWKQDGPLLVGQVITAQPTMLVQQGERGSYTSTPS